MAWLLISNFTTRRMASIDVIVIYCNDERLTFMKNQLSELALPFSITYFKAYNPENSADWISKTSPASPKLQCCFRSHIEAMNSWYNRESRASYLLILEDDVCLLKSGIQTQLDAVIETYKTKPTIDYISIGYLPNTLSKGMLNENLHQAKMKDTTSNVYWDFSDADFTIWGSQAQLFSAKNISNILALLRVESADTIYTHIPNYLTRHRYHQYKTVHPTIDALLPLLFSQAIVCPPLAVENNSPSTIHAGQQTRENIWKLAETKGMLRLSDYYSYEE
jgi:GR25 family glycosyltransferase involved in LPS biosynthesis